MMAILSKNKIEEYLSHTNPEARLVITPILDKAKQLGASTVDLRLGNTFKVDVRTRQPYIDPMNMDRPIDTFLIIRTVILEKNFYCIQINLQ